jgi:membrane-associated protein
VQRRPLRDKAGVDKARDLLARFGGPAVFLGRWTAVARALVPGLTGMSGMRYRTFLLYNALGGLVWGTTFVLIGYAAGRSWEAVASRVGSYALYVLLSVVVVVVVVVVVRRRRQRAHVRRGPDVADTEGGEAPPDPSG